MACSLSQRHWTERSQGVREFATVMKTRLEKLGIRTESPDEMTEDERRRFSRLDIDPSTISWNRVLDTNDRFLRSISTGHGRRSPSVIGY